MVSNNPDKKGQPGSAEAALFGLCPQCTESTLFEGVAVIAPKCSDCGLDFTKLSAGDGSGVLLTACIAVLIIALAMGLDVAFLPPMWVHVILWVPITLSAVFVGLRAARASVIYSAFNDGQAAEK